MDSYLSDDKRERQALFVSQTLPPGHANWGKGIATWLSCDDEEETVCRQDCWAPAARSLSSSRRPSDRVLLILSEAWTITELLFQFLTKEWPTEIHLVEPFRICATIFLNFVAVKVEVRVMAGPCESSAELVFMNNSTSPDTVLFGKVVDACERQLRSQLEELPEGSLLKDELLEEDFFSELADDDDDAGTPDFQALLAELVHCSSARMREELLQTLAHLAGHKWARPSLVEAFCSPIGIFAASSYLHRPGETSASLAETFPFAYVLRQAAACDESCAMVHLTKLIAHAMQSTTAQLVARELEHVLGLLPDDPAVEEGSFGDDTDIPPTRSLGLAAVSASS